MSVKHGVPRSVREIVTAAAEAERNEDQEATGSCAPGDSVRTVGRLKTVLSLESVVIEDEGHELEVNVSLSTPCGYKAGSRYQFIGELDRRRNGSGHGVETSPVLVARISRNVNGLDLDLYRRGIEAQNECLRETPPP